MSTLAEWQTGNERYLSAAVTWMRLLLEQYLPAPPLATPATSVADVAPPKASLMQRVLRRKGEAGAPAPLLLSAPAPISNDQIKQAAAEMAAAESEMDPPPALVLLSRRLGMSPFERDILLLCTALELDTRIAHLCSRVQGDPAKPYPTFALALTLLDEPAWDALSPERPLRYWRLVEINQPGSQPLTASALRADERIVNYIKGLNYLDDRLTPLFGPIAPPGGDNPLPPSQQNGVETILCRWQHNAERTLPLVQLLGPDEPSKQLIAAHTAIRLGLHLYRLPVSLLPTSNSDLETLARLWQREVSLMPLALYLDAQETTSTAEGQPLLNRFLSRCNGPLFLAIRERSAPLDRASFALDVAKPLPVEQRDTWAASLGEAAGDLPDQLSAQFNLNLASIRQIVATEQAETEAAPPLHEGLWQACRAHARPRLESLAQRIEAKATWDDLVLPERETQLLRQIAGQVAHRAMVYQTGGFANKMNRGFGISALFAGSSGTGKTMAAEVIANDLRLDLYRIDLSAVVNKYIGETEKNLRRLFDAAEDGGAILFFDEADALFGKRSEVKDSHDRYANIEVNYLLQRIESYRGLAILATNMKGALDTAFLRRLRFIVNFPVPAVAQRKAIWQKIFPPETRTEGLDFDRLARLHLTGGLIHNVALNAAFLAAQNGAAVTLPLVLTAARAEFHKEERPIKEDDFRWMEKA